MNGAVEINARFAFTLVVANFSHVRRTLPGGMVIALESLNPSGMYLFDDNTSRSFEQVLNLPLKRDVVV